MSAPASSANLGPGFDCLGLALALPFELIDADELTAGGDAPEGFLPAEPTHPAAVAFVAAGGDASLPIWWRSPIPPGRGLGFSGAARVAGAYLAQRRSGSDDLVARSATMQIAGELEGHPDNAAASTHGGLTVAVGEQVVQVPVPGHLLDDLRVVVWSPVRSTSTDASRRVLVDDVPLADAVFSIGRAALWVAAITAGQLTLLRTASDDRVHQPARFAAREDSHAAFEVALAEPSVLAAWLSGSGPSVAALLRSRDAAAFAASFGTRLIGTAADEGRVRTLALDVLGVRSLD